jgi:DNA (cytosine-5)-methyltransferase 1
MRYGSVCSGIEAATQAWHPLGWSPSFFSEIDPFPRAVLEHHYPDVPLHGDFTTIEDGQYEPIDLLVGGTPCQSFSIAGLRGGLGDDRGNLALEFLRLADRLRPRWLVWENVPGVLSSLSHDAPDACPPTIDLDREDGPKDGEEIVVTDEYEADENHALWCFMAGASELGYDGGFRVIDAQYTRTCNLPFAVPQRRRRVLFVGYLGDWRRAAAVLFDRDSLSRNSPPRREAGQTVAPTISARPTGGGGLGTDFDLDGGLVANSGDVSYCLAASAQQSLDAETETETLIAAFDCKGSEVQFATDGSHPTLRSMGHNSSHQNAGGHAAVATNWAVRRLTPVECERLQGFSDGFTNVPWRGKGHSPDGRRYKALGNSMAVNVMRWLGDRIEIVDQIAPNQPPAK